MEKSVVVLIFLVIALALAGLTVYYLVSLFGGISASEDFMVENIQFFNNGKLYLKFRNLSTLTCTSITIQVDRNLDGNPDMSYVWRGTIPSGKEQFLEVTFSSSGLTPGQRVKIIITADYSSARVKKIYDAVVLAW